jgi:D-alanine-D-alanine ligase
MDTKTLLEQQEQESDEPPGIRPRPARPWRVAIVANVKGETSLPHDGPPDAGAEFDGMETIQAIRSAIEADGHVTSLLPADSTLPDRLKKFCPDICFNISEGLGGDAREAQVPALLEMLHVPYTASRVLANAIGLDKTMTKRIWRDLGLPTASFQEFLTGDEPLSGYLRFPLFVKPAREGTGMGMDGNSIVYNEQQLRRRVRWTVETYHQPALVEDYLPGREFTVGVLGRPDAARYSPRPELYSPDGFYRLPVLEVEASKSITPGVYGNQAKSLHRGDAGFPEYVCPADIDLKLARKLQELAIRGHIGIGALDVSRIDFRLDFAGEPRLLEINALPGLSPGFSDLCLIAEAGGLSYQDLILEILYLGASRYGMLQPVGEAQPVEINVSNIVELPL